MCNIPAQDCNQAFACRVRSKKQLQYCRESLTNKPMKRTTRVLFVMALLSAATFTFAQRAAQQRPGNLSMPTRLQVGDAAPDFKLKTKDGSREVQLSSFKGKRPVVLVFGSYT